MSEERLPTAILLLAAAVWPAAAQQTPSAEQTTPSAALASPGALQQGIAALHAGNAQQALTFFQQVLAADPNSAPANLLAASAAIQLFDAAAAVHYGERAHALEPTNWKVDTSLVTAYAMAGELQKRDQQRNLLTAAHANPALPEAHQTSGFLLDRFRAGAYSVDAVQYFKPIGTFNTYYRFLVHDAAGKLVWTIQLDSDSLNEASWAMQYPREAKQGQRQFQIESSPGQDQVLYRTFSGAPNYDYVRTQIIKLVSTHTGPFPEAAPAT